MPIIDPAKINRLANCRSLSANYLENLFSSNDLKIISKRYHLSVNNRNKKQLADAILDTLKDRTDFINLLVEINRIFDETQAANERRINGNNNNTSTSANNNNNNNNSNNNNNPPNPTINPPNNPSNPSNIQPQNTIPATSSIKPQSTSSSSKTTTTPSNSPPRDAVTPHTRRENYLLQEQNKIKCAAVSLKEDMNYCASNFQQVGDFVDEAKDRFNVLNNAVKSNKNDLNKMNNNIISNKNDLKDLKVKVTTVANLLTNFINNFNNNSNNNSNNNNNNNNNDESLEDDDYKRDENGNILVPSGNNNNINNINSSSSGSAPNAEEEDENDWDVDLSGITPQIKPLNTMANNNNANSHAAEKQIRPQAKTTNKVVKPIQPLQPQQPLNSLDTNGQPAGLAPVVLDFENNNNDNNNGSNSNNEYNVKNKKQGASGFNFINRPRNTSPANVNTMRNLFNTSNVAPPTFHARKTWSDYDLNDVDKFKTLSIKSVGIESNAEAEDVFAHFIPLFKMANIDIEHLQIDENDNIMLVHVEADVNKCHVQVTFKTNELCEAALKNIRFMRSPLFNDHVGKILDEPAYWMNTADKVRKRNMDRLNSNNNNNKNKRGRGRGRRGRGGRGGYNRRYYNNNKYNNNNNKYNNY